MLPKSPTHEAPAVETGYMPKFQTTQRVADAPGCSPAELYEPAV